MPTSAKPANQSKEEIYFAVCNAILKMEFAKGHLKWTVSDIARESKITRSLVYYYFGKEKKDVLAEAYRFIISHFYNIERVKKTLLKERLAKTLKDVRAMPYLFILLYIEKGRDSDFGRMILRSEKALFEALKVEFPHLTETHILEIYMLQLGAMTYHFPPERVGELFSKYR
jgi:AcrR family transcriptional regulator